MFSGTIHLDSLAAVFGDIDPHCGVTKVVGRQNREEACVNLARGKPRDRDWANEGEIGGTVSVDRDRAAHVLLAIDCDSDFVANTDRVMGAMNYLLGVRGTS